MKVMHDSVGFCFSSSPLRGGGLPLRVVCRLVRPPLPVQKNTVPSPSQSPPPPSPPSTMYGPSSSSYTHPRASRVPPSSRLFRQVRRQELVHLKHGHLVLPLEDRLERLVAQDLALVARVLQVLRLDVRPAVVCVFFLGGVLMGEEGR